MSDRRAGLITLGIVVAAIVLLLLPHIAFRDRVLPRVTSGGIEVGGLHREAAEEAVAAAAETTAAGTRMVVRDPVTGMTWTHTAAELGGAPDPSLTAERLLAAGRTGLVGATVGPWLTIVRGKDVPQAWSFLTEPSDALAAIAAAATVPPHNARLEVIDGQQVPVPSAPGRTVNVERTAEALIAALESGGEVVDLRFAPTGARIGSLEDVATAWDTILSAPLRITWESDVLVEVPVAELAEWFRLEDIASAEGDLRPTIVVDRNAILAKVIELAPVVQRQPADARFALDEVTRRASVLRSGHAGAQMDVERTVNRVIEGAYTRQRVAEVAANLTPARIQPEDASSLDFALPVSRAYIRYAASPAGREQNIRTAAEALAGVALGPAQELSLLASLGAVDGERGYATAFLRPQPEAPPGWTGGVEQMASAFYRAAMWGGLMVRERHAVPFRVGWLEPPVGFDAAVQSPDTDLVIANQTESFLLFESAIDTSRESVVVTLLASPVFTPTVAVGGPLVSEITPPAEPATVPDGSVPAGARVQVGWAREGARARVIRTVNLPGTGALTDEIESAYVPARRVDAVGTAR